LNKYQISDEVSAVHIRHKVDRESLQDESIIEDQLDEFLSRLELLESEEYNGMDDEDLDLPVKERVLMIKLEKTTFDPLLSSIKTSQPVLYKELLQHSMIVGQHKSSRKQSKRDKKKDKKNERDRERERSLAQAATLAGGKTRYQKRDKNASGDTSDTIRSLADFKTSPEKNAVLSREALAAVVAKGVVEGTTSAHLISIALLLQIMKDDKVSTGRNSSNNTSNAIPVGNVLAAIFECPEVDDDDDRTSDGAGASSTQNSTGSNRETNPYLLNPFHTYLLAPRDELAKSVAYSDVSRGDMGSVDETRTEDTASQAGGGEGSGGYPGPHSDAGSTTGSTRAEQGTETASVDEEATEDELLAQALAMSMGGTAVSTGDSGVSFDINMRDKSYSSAESSSVSAAGSSGPVLSSAEPRSSSFSPNIDPAVQSMSTFGAMCSSEFWRSLGVTSSEHSDHTGGIPVVSVRNTIIALITIIRAGADKVIGEVDFSTALSSMNKSQAPINVFEQQQAQTCTSTAQALYTSQTPATSPNTVTFLLVELLLDRLLGDLKSHNQKVPFSSASPSVKRGSFKSDKADFEGENKEGGDMELSMNATEEMRPMNASLTEVLLKERNRKGRQHLFATTANPQEEEPRLSSEDVAVREWAFQRCCLLSYLILWL
jgi:hypothetical protein